MRSEDRRVTRSPQTGASNARLRLEQPCTLVAVGVDPELAHHRLVLIDGGGGVGTLVRVDPDGDQGVLQADGVDGMCATGGQT